MLAENVDDVAFQKFVRLFCSWARYRNCLDRELLSRLQRACKNLC